MRYLTLALFCGLAAFALIACPPRGTPQPVPPGDPGQGYEPPPPIDAGPEAAPDDEPEAETDDGIAGDDGAACSVDADCTSGECEGLGCGKDEGMCAPASRGCTRDRRAYCGCDGVTFYSSGSCPGARYASTGECPP